MKICCGIILYNPTIEDVDNIFFYKNNFDAVYIYDNTEKSNEVINNKINKENFAIISEGINNGLSIACNELCQKAKSDGFDYIILYDQDSRMEEKDIKRYKNINFEDNVAIYTPQIVYKGKSKINNNNNIEYINWCITSGSMINLKYFGDLFCFDTNYFIDRVDKDYCQQVIDNGKKIARVNSVILFQELGEMRMIRGKAHYNHSALRHYYMFRNRFYYNKKFKVRKIITFFQTLNHLKSIILYETNKCNKLKTLVKANKDFKYNRMGKCDYI